ncbi:hypothetical protein RCIP0102_00176 [Klebsiella phage RCIP0102]|uniref:Uncharacterized protein n=1 Tax=Klebsiella phage RCIP0102 TaxID=3094270 RepID=A0AAX4H1U6_9VIRU
MIDIKLDTYAVRQLFPEGTEARAQLQQSVINNIVKEMVLKNSENKIKEAVASEVATSAVTIPNVRREVKSQVEKMFHTRGWNDMSATEELSHKMRLAADAAANEAINTMIREMIDSAIASAETRIKRHLDAANDRIQQIMISAINTNFKQQVNEVIAAKFAEHFPVKAK